MSITQKRHCAIISYSNHSSSSSNPICLNRDKSLICCNENHFFILLPVDNNSKDKRKGVQGNHFIETTNKTLRYFVVSNKENVFNFSG
ncbi:CLUMA_CG010229, isoform A, partial [Clunio marinus]